MEDYEYFHPIMLGLIREAFTKLKKTMLSLDGNSKAEITFPIAKEVLKDFNGVLPTDYPHIITIKLVLRGSGKKIEPIVHTAVRQGIPGLHDCLRSDILPILTIRPDDENDPECATGRLINIEIWPPATEDEISS
jgi:hypothetical protein